MVFSKPLTWFSVDRAALENSTRPRDSASEIRSALALEDDKFFVYKWQKCFDQNSPKFRKTSIENQSRNSFASGVGNRCQFDSPPGTTGGWSWNTFQPLDEGLQFQSVQQSTDLHTMQEVEQDLTTKYKVSRFLRLPASSMSALLSRTWGVSR